MSWITGRDHAQRPRTSASESFEHGFVDLDRHDDRVARERAREEVEDHRDRRLCPPQVQPPLGRPRASPRRSDEHTICSSAGTSTAPTAAS